MKRYITILFTLFILCLPAAVYAETGERHRIGRHYTLVCDAVKAKLNLSDEEIIKARNSGKTAFDVAREKGVGESELREYIILSAGESLDKSSMRNFMPDMLVNRIKEKVRSSIYSWDGGFQ